LSTSAVEEGDVPTGSGVRPLRADAARNRQAVIDAARDAFTRRGVGASLDDVARAAGVGPGTLYRNFPTRDDLVLAVLEENLIDLRRLGAELLDGPDPLEAVTRWLDAYIEQCNVFDGLARTMACPPTHADEKGICRAALGAGAALIRRAAQTGALRSDIDADEVVHLAAAIAWVVEQPSPDPQRRARLMRVMLDGIRPR
jgi:AcrR family transcriptional regulator